MADNQKELVQSVMAPENILHLSHGSGWMHPALPNATDGKIETHSAEFEIPHQKVVDGDLSIIEESIDNICKQMKRQFLRSMYELINETCERTGNTITASQSGGIAEAIELTLQKVEFSVDRNGNVSLPQIHVGDAEKLESVLSSQPEEFHKRIEVIIREKSEKALQEEKARRARFKGAP